MVYTPERKSRTRPAPKPHLAHPSALELQAITRRIAHEANFATGGGFDDKLELAFAAGNEGLGRSIKAVHAAYPKTRAVVARAISGALVTRNSDRRAAEITTKAIRKDRGGRL